MRPSTNANERKKIECERLDGLTHCETFNRGQAGAKRGRKRTPNAEVRVAQPTAKLSTADERGPSTNANGKKTTECESLDRFGLLRNFQQQTKRGPNIRKRTPNAEVRVAQPTAKLSTADERRPRTNVNGGEKKCLPNLTITN